VGDIDTIDRLDLSFLPCWKDEDSIYDCSNLSYPSSETAIAKSKTRLFVNVPSNPFNISNILSSITHK
jgi:hypothetical protein